ncbi:hypothetical protein [Moraxella sp. VT-16-12]|uniref:hypothetical protein n=1 Tax=Moraxella sp. VT-16-12 TaxID=2014877 RepID=UPI000B7F03BF|nr:hypothetical protein [Moraxella sp. VT-16-12]TWV80420.1 hypothetical protein CEW93_010050 [Moraxella sp. VT-16-12]
MSFKTAIFATIKSLKPEAYTCPVTGEKAYIKRFTVAERENYIYAVNKAQDGLSNATGFTMIMCDEKGNLLFGEDDIEKIAALPDDIVGSALKAFNTQKTLGIEQAEKNSEPT